MKTNAEAVTTEDTAAVAAQGAQVTPAKAPSRKGASQKKGAPKGRKRAKTAKPTVKPKAQKQKKDRQPNSAGEKPVAREGTAKAKVIALIQRKDGATLDEIMKATGWRSHSVRGFISTLGKKAGLNITSSRRDDGARVYTVAR